MNKLWALAPLLVLMMNSGAKGTEQEPVTVHCEGKNYYLRVYDADYWATEYNEPLFIDATNKLAYARTIGEIHEIRQVEGGITEFLEVVPLEELWNRRLDNEKFLKVGHEARMVTAILREFKDNPLILEQLKRCYIGKRFGDYETIEATQAYKDFMLASNTNDNQPRGPYKSRVFYTKYIIPAVAVLAVVGVVVKYRTALKHMTTKTKDRIVAWWHKADQPDYVVRTV